MSLPTSRACSRPRFDYSKLAPGWKNNESGLTIYRQHLPHWRQQGATYFVTWRVARGQPELSPNERTLVCSAIKHFEGSRYELHAFVVMNDHVHALFTPESAHAMTAIVHSWKSYTARSIQLRHHRLGTVWQREFFDRIVRNEAEFLQKANYILSNPFNRWPEIMDYAWMGIGQSQGVVE